MTSDLKTKVFWGDYTKALYLLFALTDWTEIWHFDCQWMAHCYREILLESDVVCWSYENAY